MMATVDIGTGHERIAREAGRGHWHERRKGVPGQAACAPADTGLGVRRPPPRGGVEARFVASMLATLMLAGCAVGPNYKRPSTIARSMLQFGLLFMITLIPLLIFRATIGTMV